MNTRRFLAVAALAAGLLLTICESFAQTECRLKPDMVVKLYPEGQDADKGVDGLPGPLVSNGITQEEAMNDNGILTNITEGRMKFFFPKKPNGQMVVVCPGGGYYKVSSHGEGLYVAEWMLAQGVSVCIVEYRLPGGHWEIPLHDMHNVFRYCRKHAQEWGVDQIGVMGFSAGGHLAGITTTMFVDEITRPDFSILVYPVTSLDRKYATQGTRINLLGKNELWERTDVSMTEYEASMKKFAELISYYSPVNHVSGNTPESFIVHCTDDKRVPVEHSINYYRKLIENKVPVEMHIYPTGGHGWGFSSEKYKGKGKDKFAYARDEFEYSLARWMKGLREKSEQK